MYSQTPLYGHPVYGQFALSLGKESPYIFSKLNPLNTDTPFVRIAFMAPSVSVLRGFDIIYMRGRTSRDFVNTQKMSNSHFLKFLTKFQLIPSCRIRSP